MDLRPNPRRVIPSQSSTCPICFSKLSDQLIGCLDNCDHKFCLDCILKWSKDNNVCPVDRINFQNVNVAHKGISFAKVEIQPIQKKRPRPELYNFTTFCEICRSQDREQLIHCNSCDLGFHLYCLKPALDFEFNDDWYCPDCAIVLLRKPKKVPKLSRKKNVLSYRTKSHGSKSSDGCASIENENSSSDESDSNDTPGLKMENDNFMKKINDGLEAETDDGLEAETDDDPEAETDDDPEAETDDDPEAEEETDDDSTAKTNNDINNLKERTTPICHKNLKVIIKPDGSLVYNFI